MPRVVAIAAAAMLAGCAGRGLDIERLATDPLITNSVTADSGPMSGDAALLSDRMIIRNAVSSAVVDEVTTDGVGWANAETGSRGTIRTLVENRENAYLCRSFDATRESYDGVHLYRGKACLDAAKNWAIPEFARVE